MQIQYLGRFNHGPQLPPLQVLKNQQALTALETFDGKISTDDANPNLRSINYQIAHYDFEFKPFDSIVSVDPNLTLTEAVSLRNGAISAYTQNNGINMSSFEDAEGGVIIYGKGYVNVDGQAMLSWSATKTFVSWEDLGLGENPLLITAGGTYLRSNIFGDVKLEGGHNVMKEIIFEQSELYRTMTEQWISANGNAPDFSNAKFDLSTDITHYTPKMARDNDPHSLLYLKRVNGELYYLQGEEFFTSTDKAISTFISDYNKIVGQKKAMIAQLTEYYSLEAIMQRAQNAGFANDAELLQKIIETQTKYGESLINGITTRGAIDVRDDLETALTKYLAGTNNPGWAFNNIPNLAGVNMNGITSEARNIMASDFAKAALSGGGNIRIGDMEVTYQEFLDMEKAMNDAFRGLSAILAIGDSDLNIIYSNPTLPRIQETMQKWLAGQQNADMKNLVSAWFNKTLDDFNHINKQRSEAYNARDWDNLLKWNSPHKGKYSNMVTQGFDSSKLFDIAIKVNPYQ